MGIHGLGEGWDFGSAASLAGTSLINAFGGLGAVASYPIHKFLEASIIAATYSAYVGRSGIASARAKWHLPVLGLLFGLTSVIGALLGYYISLDTTYFFAFGVTAAFYATLRLVEAMNPRFKIGDGAPSYLGWKVFLVHSRGIPCVLYCCIAPFLTAAHYQLAVLHVWMYRAEDIAIDPECSFFVCGEIHDRDRSSAQYDATIKIVSDGKPVRLRRRAVHDRNHYLLAKVHSHHRPLRQEMVSASIESFVGTSRICSHD